MTDPAVIGLDWGTTNARAYLIDRDGSIVAETAAQPLGIMQVADGGYPAALARLLDALPMAPPPGLPLVLSGMVTSRQGWVETGYVACPADFAAVAAAAEIRSVDGRTLVFAPGVSFHDEAGVADVMRGEELQILGAVESGCPARVFCLPGTHSKWAWVADGRIVRFRTVMTGETFAALSDHTILGRLMADRAHDADAFRHGADRARHGGYVLHDIFGARSEALFGRLAPDAIASYLSGLLIGHEVAAMAGDLDGGEVVAVVGGAALAERYCAAMAVAGVGCQRIDDPVVTRGQVALARAAGVTG
ncbi:MAG: 2-dehydro-3-deoxygalactonokinase [Alphaproteobacteria bacterium]